MTFIFTNSDSTKWMKIKISKLSPYLSKSLCLCVSVFRYRHAGKVQLTNLGLFSGFDLGRQQIVHATASTAVNHIIEAVRPAMHFSGR